METTLVDTNTYNFYRDFLFQQSGYVLTEEKKYLLDTKLDPVLEQHNIPNVIELANRLNTLPTNILKQDVIDAMTINETFFFRDKSPFEVLERVVSDVFIKQQERTTLNFWSAACSSGQEPYSLAMVMEKVAKEVKPINYKIQATDISTEIVAKAKEGVYNDFEVKRGLTEAQIANYFDKKTEGWQIRDLLKRHIEFKTGNLVRDFYTGGPFDVIFLRNVLIYFDTETKTRILEKMHRIIAPQGYLVLGAPETVMGLGDYFSPIPEFKGFYVPNH